MILDQQFCEGRAGRNLEKLQDIGEKQGTEVTVWGLECRDMEFRIYRVGSRESGKVLSRK